MKIISRLLLVVTILSLLVVVYLQGNQISTLGNKVAMLESSDRWHQQAVRQEMDIVWAELEAQAKTADGGGL